MLDKISRGLDGWKETLVFGWGNNFSIVLLSHILMYFLSLFKIPTLVVLKIEKLYTNFLWFGIGMKIEIILLVEMSRVDQRSLRAKFR